MIEIIKRGTKEIADCKTCGCQFSYEKEDIKRGDQRDPYKVVECPCCKNRIDLR